MKSVQCFTGDIACAIPYTQIQMKNSPQRKILWQLGWWEKSKMAQKYVHIQEKLIQFLIVKITLTYYLMANSLTNEVNLKHTRLNRKLYQKFKKVCYITISPENRLWWFISKLNKKKPYKIIFLFAILVSFFSSEIFWHWLCLISIQYFHITLPSPRELKYTLHYLVPNER